jgi:hypothetical protein
MYVDMYDVCVCTVFRVWGLGFRVHTNSEAHMSNTSIIGGACWSALGPRSSVCSLKKLMPDTHEYFRTKFLSALQVWKMLSRPRNSCGSVCRHCLRPRQGLLWHHECCVCVCVCVCERGYSLPSTCFFMCNIDKSMHIPAHLHRNNSFEDIYPRIEKTVRKISTTDGSKVTLHSSTQENDFCMNLHANGSLHAFGLAIIWYLHLHAHEWSLRQHVRGADT